MMDETGPRASIVVPTRNRERFLPGLLAALDVQDFCDYEVVVVDDASADDTWKILSAWQRQGRCALRLERPSGSYAARNRGWRTSRGWIVAFTDDDCLPQRDWLSNLVVAFQGRDVVAVQGVTIAEPGEITPFTHQIDQRRPGPPYRTCNMAYRRSLLEQLDGFNDSLRWYADNLLGQRARRMGTVAFAPGAVVQHPPRPREWRNRDQWRQRFAADAVHRRELQHLGVEPALLPSGALPVVLWILRPLVKQSLFHLRYLCRHPGEYVRQAGPMAREKLELLAALWEFWGVRLHKPGIARTSNVLRMKSGNLPRSNPADCRRASRHVAPSETIDAKDSKEPLPPLSEEPLISIVVVTRNRPQVLDGALTSLEGQTYLHRELIVVDNSEDGSARDVARRHGALYVAAPRETLGEVRQAGIQAASGEIVAFTDDDCLADPCWAHAIVDAFRRQPWLYGVQGETRPERGPVGAHVIRVLHPDSLYRTCNIAYRRAALERAGGCDVRFRGWFEDTALAARVLLHGPIGFEGRATVTHRAMPRHPLDRAYWRVLLEDERRLAREYSEFYRRTRGRSFLSAVIARWLLGSPAKALIRELPRALGDPRGFLVFIRLLLQERWELLRALGRQ